MRGARVLGLPYVAGIALLVALPAAGGLYLAFTEFTGVQPPRFNAVENLQRLAGDAMFRRAVANSAIYAAIAVPLRVIAAVGLALLLARPHRGAAPARALVFMPTVIPDAAFALLWLWLLNPLYGPLGFAAWLTDPTFARAAMPLMALLQIGEGFLIALAARRALPRNLYDVASVEGASAWFTTRRVTLPLMAPAIVLLALRDLVLSLQANVVAALLVTDGGPRYATTYLPLYAYRTAFRYFRLGYASTLSLVMFVLAAILVYAAYRTFRRYAHT